MWELGAQLDPLGEQPALLMAELSLSPHKLHFETPFKAPWVWITMLPFLDVSCNLGGNWVKDTLQGSRPTM